MAPDHASASRMLAHALALRSREAWIGAALVWRIRLDRDELFDLFFAISSALGEEAATEAWREAFGDDAPPLPEFTSVSAEARAWAAVTRPDVMKHYVAAALAVMPASDRRALAEHLSKERAA